jgi:hypothetical protein
VLRRDTQFNAAEQWKTDQQQAESRQSEAASKWLTSDEAGLVNATLEWLS